MPPRRAPKKQNNENEEIEKSKPKRGRNATAAIDNLEDEEPHKKKAPVKRGGKAAAHEAFAIVFDVGSNSAEKLHDGELSDLEHSKVVLDWVLSRKASSITIEEILLGITYHRYPIKCYFTSQSEIKKFFIYKVIL